MRGARRSGQHATVLPRDAVQSAVRRSPTSARIADIAHERGVLLAVDNCFCTPALQKPFELGADLVIHSATKYLDGQGRCVGGAVVGNEQLVGKDVFGFIRSAGPSMSPFNAWVFLKGLETLELRMRAHSAAALELAQWLEGQPGVRKVHYAGLESHPQHALARASRAATAASSLSRSDNGRDGRVGVHRCDTADVDHRQPRRRQDHDHASGDARRIRASQRRSASVRGSPKACCASRSASRTCDDIRPTCEQDSRRSRPMTAAPSDACARSASTSTTRSGTSGR